jgi:hypothetical protein
MLEVAAGVLGTDRRERHTYRFYQNLLGPGRGLAEQVLDLGKRLEDTSSTQLGE